MPGASETTSTVPHFGHSIVFLAEGFRAVLQSDLVDSRRIAISLEFSTQIDCDQLTSPIRKTVREFTFLEATLSPLEMWGYPPLKFCPKCGSRLKLGRRGTSCPNCGSMGPSKVGLADFFPFGTMRPFQRDILDKLEAEMAARRKYTYLLSARRVRQVRGRRGPLSLPGLSLHPHLHQATAEPVRFRLRFPGRQGQVKLPVPRPHVFRSPRPLQQGSLRGGLEAL